jgi:single-strand selective monofunctional uracil DNA glycosylase
MDLLRASDELCRELAGLRFGPPVTHVYNPLLYAREAYAEYLRRCGQGHKRVVFLGMNPGPWGMAQTGVPFGDARLVREWLRIEAPIGRPALEHPSRPVLGLECKRTEVSGSRVWGLARRLFDTPERFFEEHFVANYCPCCFMEQSGRNRTPDKLPRAERQRLLSACDRHLQRLADALSPRFVIGVGAFATERARRALEGRPVLVGQILHPSPASPRANHDWAGKVLAELRAQRVCQGGSERSEVRQVERAAVGGEEGERGGGGPSEAR